MPLNFSFRKKLEIKSKEDKNKLNKIDNDTIVMRRAK